MIWRSLLRTLTSFWITFPLFTQIVMACCSVASVCLLARPCILVKLTPLLLDHMWYYLWSSGGNLMSEIGNFVLLELGTRASRKRHSHWRAEDQNEAHGTMNWLIFDEDSAAAYAQAYRRSMCGSQA